MFCPICKSEYIDTIKECNECKVPLVDSLDDNEFEGLAPDYIPGDENLDTNSENEKNSNKDTNEDIDEKTSAKSALYVKKKDKYSDLRFSGFSFIIFGILGIVFVILNFLGIITFLTTYSIVVMSIIFVIFIGFGISSLNSACKLKDQVAKEDQDTLSLKNWLDENITDDYIDSLSDESLSEEENYIYLQEQLTNEVLEEFPDFERAYAEQILDDLLEKYFDKK